MSRARNIKPGFFTNGDLIECSPLARLLFAGLWCEADRRGILEDRPKTIKLKLLPGDNCDIEALLNELSGHGFIRRYEVSGHKCIIIPKFGTHQHPHVNEQCNGLPEPEMHSASTVQTPEQNSSNREESLLPITENGLRNTDTPPAPSEGNVQKPKRPRSIKSPVPDDLAEQVPIDEWTDMGVEQSMSMENMRIETVRMLDHFRANGEEKANWVAAWRNWMRSPYRKTAANARASPNGRMSSEDVMAEATRLLSTESKPENVIDARFRLGGNS